MDSASQSINCWIKNLFVYNKVKINYIKLLIIEGRFYFSFIFICISLKSNRYIALLMASTKSGSILPDKKVSLTFFNSKPLRVTEIEWKNSMLSIRNLLYLYCRFAYVIVGNIYVNVALRRATIVGSLDWVPAKSLVRLELHK